MSRLSETYKLTVTPLMPIHIGSGEEISPGEYFIFKDDPTSYALYAVDVGYLASRLKPESRRLILRWLERNPIGWVKDAAQARGFPDLVRKYCRFRSEVTNRVAKEMENRWGQDRSRLEVRTLQRPFKDPIIPGSSIKGAIRTALLYAKVERPLQQAPVRQTKVASFERQELGGRSGSIQNDPLRHLKIADAVAKDLLTVVYQAEFYGMRSAGGDQADLQVYCECFPETFDAEDRYSLETTLSITSGHPEYGKDARSVTADAIVSACNDFYGAVVKAELKYWTEKKDKEMVEYYEQLQGRLGQAEGTALIRLGWGSGMDSVGLNLAKPPGGGTTRTRDFRYRQEVRTRRLLNGLPPGWAEIKLEKV